MFVKITLLLRNLKDKLGGMLKNGWIWNGGGVSIVIFTQTEIIEVYRTGMMIVYRPGVAGAVLHTFVIN